MSQLKFYVKEDGCDYPLSWMTAGERRAIEECVNNLLRSKINNHYWLEADTHILDQDGPDFGLLRCIDKMRSPCPIPLEILKNISGTTFRIHPPQTGPIPWAEGVEVVFEKVSVIHGTKASDLIAAALKQQKSSLPTH